MANRGSIMPRSFVSKMTKLIKGKPSKPFLQRICEEVFEAHLALHCSLMKHGVYFNDPDIYCIRCIVCGYQQLMEQKEAKEFLKKSMKGENPKLEDYGLKD